MEPPPSFLKIISSSEREEIPKDFLLHMDGSLEKGTIFLLDQYNNSWPIEISRDGDEWYLDGGWGHFFRRGGLEFGDYMTFEYKSGDFFDFKLYGHNMCLKKCVVGPVMHSRNGAGPSNVCNKNSNETKKKSAFRAVMHSQNGADPSNVCNIKSKKPKTFGIDTMPRRRTYSRDADCYGDDIFESGLVRRPDNPYFVSRSRLLARKNEFNIPKEVILDHKLNLPETLFLVDEAGIKYEAQLTQWTDGRIWCIKGWKDLCKANRIKIDDVCICKIMEEGASILVSVVPGQGSSQGNSSSDK